MKNIFCLAILFCSLSAGVCNAGIAITITEASSTTVTISWTGSGTVVDSSGVGSTLGFLNFGDIFTFGDLEKERPVSVLSDLIFTNTTTNMDFIVDSVLFDASNSSDQDDIQFQLDLDSFGDEFANGNDFEVSGSTTLTDISIDHFIVGDFDADDIGDADNLGGGVSLSIVALTAVPEPTSLTLFAMAIGSCLVGRRRRQVAI